MNNRYGVGADYFVKKMKRIIRDIEHYKPDEIAREFARMSVKADENVLREIEFNQQPAGEQ